MPTAMKKRKLMGEINVVPYIDVMLVLLVIFMVTAPLLTQGIEVELPKANAEPIEVIAPGPVTTLVQHLHVIAAGADHVGHTEPVATHSGGTWMADPQKG